MSYIDLSHSINEYTPVHIGDKKVEIETHSHIAEGAFEEHILHIGTHVGTHIDVPSHMIAGGKTLDQYPVEKFIGRGVIINAQGKTTIGADALVDVDIQPGDMVLFYSGMDKKYHRGTYFGEYLRMQEDLVELLISKKPTMVGVDSYSFDKESWPIHKLLLANDILILENLTNLHQLIGKSFKIYALPLALELDGAPVRVVAEINN